jgi:hypothetical protein
MRTHLLLPAVVLVSTAAPCAAEEKTGPKPDPVAVRKLVEQLQSDDFQTREKATHELSKLEEVPDELRRATNSDDLEVRRRAQSAVAAITARAEGNAFQALAADLQKVEVDRFVRQMVTEVDFADDKHWEFVQKLTRALTARASTLGGRKFEVTDLDMKSLAQQTTLVQGEYGFKGKRILLRDPKAAMTSVIGCVILSTVPTPRVTHLQDSIVIVDGGFTGATTVKGCLLIVLGDVGRMTSVQKSIILATGAFPGATVSEDSFFQVRNQQLRFTRSHNNVYVKSTPEFAGNDINGRVLETEHGPLQMLRFGGPKRDNPPKQEKP